MNPENLVQEYLLAGVDYTPTLPQYQYLHIPLILEPDNHFKHLRLSNRTCIAGDIGRDELIHPVTGIHAEQSLSRQFISGIIAIVGIICAIAGRTITGFP
jgi:hypothetical protein